MDFYIPKLDDDERYYRILKGLERRGFDCENLSLEGFITGVPTQSPKDINNFRESVPYDIIIAEGLDDISFEDSLRIICADTATSDPKYSVDWQSHLKFDPRQTPPDCIHLVNRLAEIYAIKFAKKNGTLISKINENILIIGLPADSKNTGVIAVDTSGPKDKVCGFYLNAFLKVHKNYRRNGLGTEMVCDSLAWLGYVPEWEGGTPVYSTEGLKTHENAFHKICREHDINNDLKGLINPVNFF